MDLGHRKPPRSEPVDQEVKAVLVFGEHQELGGRVSEDPLIGQDLPQFGELGGDFPLLEPLGLIDQGEDLRPLGL